MTINVTVIGAGSWGTTVAALTAVNTPTVLWSRRAALAEQINLTHVNGDYLADFVLPPNSTPPVRSPRPCPTQTCS